MAALPTTVRESVSSLLAPDVANNRSYGPAISADGRYVAFTSSASNLVPGDTNGFVDVFVRDRVANTTRMVSLATDGSPSQGESMASAISADGRYVVFRSWASDLVPGDTNDAFDVFVRDMVANATTRVSIGADGTQGDRGIEQTSANAISADGRYVAFSSPATNLVPDDTNGRADIFVRDTVANITTRVSVTNDGAQANSSSVNPAISADGRFVTFEADDGGLDPGDANGYIDVFVRDRVANTTMRVSVAPDGSDSDGHSFHPSISANGGYVAFESRASNLVPDETGGTCDIFVRDIAGQTTSRASVTADGSQADADSYAPSLSADGRFVFFVSFAANLDPGDANGRPDVYVRDRIGNTSARLSVALDGAQADGEAAFTAPAATPDGRNAAFAHTAGNLVAGDTNGLLDIFVRDREANATSKVSVAVEASTIAADGPSRNPALSADGRFLAFSSLSEVLVPGNTNHTWNIYRRDRVNQVTTRESVATDGTQANGPSGEANYPNYVSISADGRYIAFISLASNLAPGDNSAHRDVYWRDTVAKVTKLVSVGPGGRQAFGDALSCAISGDGRYVAFWCMNGGVFPDDNGAWPTYVRDTATDITTRVSDPDEGQQTSPGGGFPSLNSDGRYVAFDTSHPLIEDDTNTFTDVYVRDRSTNDLIRASLASDGSQNSFGGFNPALSANGWHVAFVSAGKLVPEKTDTNIYDIFVRDLAGNATRRASVAASGGQANAQSRFPTISGDGRYVLFQSSATNLVEGDTNGGMDVFLRDMAESITTRVSVAADGTEGNRPVGEWTISSISADGRFAAFGSDATNLVPGDTNNAMDIFVRGPLFDSPGAFTMSDVLAALRAGGGLAAPDADTVQRLDVEPGPVTGFWIDLRDAVRLAREVAGLDANP